MLWLAAIALPVFGNFVIKKTVLYLREKHRIYKSFKQGSASKEEKDNYNRSTELLGLLESAAYFFSIVFKFEQFIGWWLVVKMAGRWSPGGPPQEVDLPKAGDSEAVKKEKKRRAAAALNIFLIGNLLNIFFGVGGGLIAREASFLCQIPVIQCLSNFYHAISVKITWEFVALLCTIPTACLAFQPRFKENFIAQLVELLKKENRDYKRDIRFDQRVLARLLFGIDGDTDWLQTFNSESEIRKKMEHDKSDAVRGLLWFLLL